MFYWFGLAGGGIRPAAGERARSDCRGGSTRAPSQELQHMSAVSVPCQSAPDAGAKPPERVQCRALVDFWLSDSTAIRAGETVSVTPEEARHLFRIGAIAIQ